LGTGERGWGLVMGVGVFFIQKNCKNVLTAYIQLKMSDNEIRGAVRLLYQDYAHIPWKQNFMYNSVYIKHGG
jgi:hypothetical protein